jgi:hypothetical protein
MNGIVSRLLKLSRQELVVQPSVATLSDINTVAEGFRKVAPIPSALLLEKILDTEQDLHPVHVKAINALSQTVEGTAAELPPALAIQLFNGLARNKHPLSGKILSSVQSKWFENWHPQSVEKGSRRPKLRQDFVGMYDENALGKLRITHSGVVRNLSDPVLDEALRNLIELKKRGNVFQSNLLIVHALVNEHKRRIDARGDTMSTDVQQFIHEVGLG